MATLALQHPELAAEQLDHAVKKLGMRGAAIGGSVEGMELSDRKFDPFWAKAQELGIVLFMHPQPAAGTTQNPRLQGKGLLGNTIGNPLETTVFLSHLIFEGTLDRFPGLKICAAHAGGYLASYSGRSDALCGRAGGNGDDCRALKKKPSEYFRRELLVDTMIFHEDGLRHLVAEAGVESDRLRHRLSVRLAGGHRLRAQREVPEQRRQGSDPRRQRDEAAENHVAVFVGRSLTGLDRPLYQSAVFWLMRKMTNSAGFIGAIPIRQLRSAVVDVVLSHRRPVAFHEERLVLGRADQGAIEPELTEKVADQAADVGPVVSPFGSNTTHCVPLSIDVLDVDEQPAHVDILQID